MFIGSSIIKAPLTKFIAFSQMGQFFFVICNTQKLIFGKFFKLHYNFKNQVIYVKWVRETEFDDHISLYSTAAAVRQRMSQRQNAVLSYITTDLSSHFDYEASLPHCGSKWHVIQI